MKNRFDLESEINNLYFIVDHLSNISEGILEHDLSTDETVNAIEGIKVILDLKIVKLLDTLSQCFKLDQYRENDSNKINIDPINY